MKVKFKLRIADQLNMNIQGYHIHFKLAFKLSNLQTYFCLAFFILTVTQVPNAIANNIERGCVELNRLHGKNGKDTSRVYTISYKDNPESTCEVDLGGVKHEIKSIEEMNEILTQDRKIERLNFKIDGLRSLHLIMLEKAIEKHPNRKEELEKIKASYLAMRKKYTDPDFINSSRLVLDQIRYYEKSIGQAIAYAINPADKARYDKPKPIQNKCEHSDLVSPSLIFYKKGDYKRNCKTKVDEYASLGFTTLSIFHPIHFIGNAKHMTFLDENAPTEDELEECLQYVMDKGMNISWKPHFESIKTMASTGEADWRILYQYDYTNEELYNRAYGPLVKLMNNNPNYQGDISISLGAEIDKTISLYPKETLALRDKINSKIRSKKKPSYMLNTNGDFYKVPNETEIQKSEIQKDLEEDPRDKMTDEGIEYFSQDKGIDTPDQGQDEIIYAGEDKTEAEFYDDDICGETLELYASINYLAPSMYEGYGHILDHNGQPDYEMSRDHYLTLVEDHLRKVCEKELLTKEEKTYKVSRAKCRPNCPKHTSSSDVILDQISKIIEKHRDSFSLGEFALKERDSNYGQFLEQLITNEKLEHSPSVTLWTDVTEKWDPLYSTNEQGDKVISQSGQQILDIVNCRNNRTATQAEEITPASAQGN